MAWLVVLLHRAPPSRLLPDGDAADAPAPATWPEVAIVVPARNEAEALPRTLPALLNQDYPGPWRVIVVDERSSDGTADVARAIARSASAPADRLEVVPGEPLPPGWAGKPWGMQQGLRRAGVLDGRGPAHVLFTDADIHHAPGSLRRLVAESERDGLDLNSRMALLRCESPAERLLIPAFLFFFATLYPMARVNANASRRSVAASAGGCQLLRAEALAGMGGVEPIASRRIDDVSLARELRSRGRRLRLACSRSDVRSLRDYPRLGDVWRMVRRSAFEELRFSWPRLAACMAALALVFVVPPLAVLSGGLSALAGGAAWLLGAACYLPAVRHFRQPAPLALTLPIAGILYGAMTLDSALRHALGKAEGWRVAPSPRT